jgi:hypothetical protein
MKTAPLDRSRDFGVAYCWCHLISTVASFYAADACGVQTRPCGANGHAPGCTSSGTSNCGLRLVATCICGSDLWPYRGRQGIAGPTPMGHEYCGVVEEVGGAVTSIRPGQLAIGSCFASDNTCPHCHAGYRTSCQRQEFVGDAQARRCCEFRWRRAHSSLHPAFCLGNCRGRFSRYGILWGRRHHWHRLDVLRVSSEVVIRWLAVAVNDPRPI